MEDGTTGNRGGGERGAAALPGLGTALLAVFGAALVAAIAIPNLMGPKCCGGNEIAAIATLRNLDHAQKDFATDAHVDLDGDRRGEFGTFGELTGANGLRTEPAALTRGEGLSRALLSPSLANVSDRGVVTKAGYAFRILLPGTGGGAVSERGIGNRYERLDATRRIARGEDTPPPRVVGARYCAGAAAQREFPDGVPAPEDEPPLSGDVDTDAAERGWLALAWPVAFGNSGTRAFLQVPGGAVWHCDNVEHAFSGTAGGREPSPACLPAGWRFGDDLPEVFTGRDGTVWRACR